MYYLTENNEIISDEEKEKMNVSNNFKKQSENVFDLIDRENDLVKIELLGGYFNIIGVKTLNGNWKENDRISAIYKPNEKGMLILEVLISDDTKYFTGKEIAESSQGTLKANGVSGSIRGLVANGLVEATNDSPKKYKITQQGIDLLG